MTPIESSEARLGPVAEVLEWDTAFFGFPIARLRTKTLDQSSGAELCTLLSGGEVQCVYCLFEGADVVGPLAAEQLGARFVDVRVTYKLDLARRAPWRGLLLTRKATREDATPLEAIAGRSHRDSRFYADPKFDERDVDRLFRTWVRRSIDGEIADGVVTFDHEGVPSGYVSYSGPARLGVAGLGEIGLVGVGESARGRGAAKELVEAGLVELARLGAQTVRVVTQGRNAGAQRLYQRAGFLTSEVGVWFHLWRSRLRADSELERKAR